MKKELEKLIFEGVLTDTIKIWGKTWTLQTINISDRMDLSKKINSDNDNLNLLKLKVELIAKSLVSIDDIILDDIEEKLEFVNKLPLAVIDKLFSKFDEMTTTLNKTIDDKDIEEIKN